MAFLQRSGSTENQTLYERCHAFLACCWTQTKMFQDFKDTVIINLYKNKGEKSNCLNYNSIMLLSYSCKIFIHLLLDRLVAKATVDHIPKIQCGFKANYVTMDKSRKSHLGPNGGLYWLSICYPKFQISKVFSGADMTCDK